MGIYSVDINFEIAQPSKEPKPTKVVGKGNQALHREGREL